MLIWKVIAANPGITRAQIWERVEHDIPAGYASRKFARVAGRPKKYTGRNEACPAYLAAARSYVLTQALQDMKRYRHLDADGSGKGQRYTAARQPTYHGNPDAIDETGMKAAEHMVLADALRVTEKMLTRRKPGIRKGPAIGMSRKEADAVAILASAVRAKRTGVNV